ncbi:MAG: hypothetical protein AAFZ67_13990 [Planctomycetota bacterium]
MRESDAAAASIQPAAPLRKLRTALIVTLLITAAVTAVASAGRVPAFQENGPVEIAQLELWIGAALFAFILAVPQTRISDKAALALVGLAAAAAAAREIDAHILLNPETIGSLGVRYRIDWWLDADVAILRKLAWASIATVGIAFVAAAIVAARFHPIRALKRRSRTIVYFGACAACLATGFAFDDLFRGVVELRTAQAIEESVEVLAPVFYLAGTNHLAVAALVGRRARDHAPQAIQPADTLTECKPTSSQSPSSTSTASASASHASTTTTRPASETASAHS